jgi:hypothetical protein
VRIGDELVTEFHAINGCLNYVVGVTDENIVSKLSGNF